MRILKPLKVICFGNPANRLRRRVQTVQMVQIVQTDKLGSVSPLLLWRARQRFSGGGFASSGFPEFAFVVEPQTLSRSIMFSECFGAKSANFA